MGEAVGEVAVGEAGELGGVGGEFAGVFEEFLGGKPVEKAAVIPFGEVLGADGDAGEVFCEDGLDFGKGVEPFDEFYAGFAVVEALVELVAEGAGETGDFAGAFHGIRGFRVVLGMGRKARGGDVECGRTRLGDWETCLPVQSADMSAHSCA